MKRLLSTLLLIAMLASTASCGNNSDNPPPQGSNDSTEATSEETTESGILSTLTPELKASLGLDGYEFNIMLRDSSSSWSIHDLIAEEETGDVLNDAVYKRNLFLEDKYGFKLVAGYSADASLSELNTYILSGDNTYDAYFSYPRQAASAASDGLLYDLNKLQYLDLDHSCWNDMFNSALSFGGKLFYAAGSISTNSYNAVRLFFFNKDIADKYQIGDPYETVRNNTWTFDTFNKMATKAAFDLNGDTNMTIADDQWGMAWQESIGGVIFYFGTGESFTSMDKDGLPYVSIGTERSIAVYDYIKNMMSDKRTYYIGADDQILTTFQEGRSLFMTEVLNCANKLRPYDIDFGLLPVPKYDESQDEYITYVDAWCISPIVVPVNVENPDRVGFMIQALAEASQQFLTSPYYDVVLSRKVLRDNESAEMLDIVLNNFVLENTDLYSWSGIQDTLRKGMANGDELSSIIAANKSSLENSMKKTIEAIVD
ncbi:MAG: extracellular solute-binding protein [Clostridiales bacterium]|nr:extracellular solute-binding protein [Clostridiales bacterium]